MQSNGSKIYFNEEITFYEKIGKILCFSEKRYSKELEEFIYSRLKSQLNSREMLKLRSKLNFITYEKIINKEYIFSLDSESKKIIKRLKRDKGLMTRLKDYRNGYE